MPASTNGVAPPDPILERIQAIADIALAAQRAQSEIMLLAYQQGLEIPEEAKDPDNPVTQIIINKFIADLKRVTEEAVRAIHKQLQHA